MKHSLVRLTKMSYLVDYLKKVVYSIAHFAGGLGALAILILALFTTVGAILRYAFDRPILGDFEITEFMLAVIVGCVLPYTQIKKGHVILDLLMSRFSSKIQFIIETILGILGVIILAFIAQQTFVHAKLQIVTGLYSPALKIPVYPFIFVSAIGWGIFCLVYLIDVISSRPRK